MKNETLDMLTELIGATNAAILIERLGGTVIYIPSAPVAKSRLVLAIGHDAATQLCRALSGTALRLPSRLSQERARRRAAILYDLSRGLAQCEVAARHGVSDRHVRAVRVLESMSCL